MYALSRSYRAPCAPVTILDTARQLARIDLREPSPAVICDLIDEAASIMGATREERLCAAGCAIIALRDERLMRRDDPLLFNPWPNTHAEMDFAFERAVAIARSPQPGAVLNVLA